MVIKIGNHVGMLSTCLWAKREIIIDDHVNIGGDCIIMDSDAHNLDWHVRDSGEMFDATTTMDVHTAACKPSTSVAMAHRCTLHHPQRRYHWMRKCDCRWQCSD